MEFSKDNNTLTLLPSNLELSDISLNQIKITPNGNIVIDFSENSYEQWSTFHNSMHQNTINYTKSNTDLEIKGGNISLGTSNNSNFSGIFKNTDSNYQAENETIHTSRFIGTQHTNNACNIKYSGMEINTLYRDKSDRVLWDEALNFYTCRNVKHPDTADTSAITLGKPAISIYSTEQLNISNDNRQGAIVIQPPNIRKIAYNADALSIGYQTYDDYMNSDSYRYCQQYIPSQKIEVNNGNIAFTSYYNSNTAVNSYNMVNTRTSNGLADSSLNQATIDGLNQIIYDQDGQGSFGWKWGHGIGSFVNYGRGYYEFPESQIETWTGNGNKEPGTDSAVYSTLDDAGKKQFRRKMLNNTMMSGVVIETHLQEHNTFLPSSYAKNVFNQDVENKQPPSESLHFMTYSKDYWSGGSKILKEWQGDKTYTNENHNKKVYGGEVRMTIDQYGNVGVGTETPAAPLEVTNFVASAPAINANSVYLGNSYSIRDAVGNIHPTTTSSYLFLASEQGNPINIGNYYSNIDVLGRTNVINRVPVSAKFTAAVVCSGVITHSDMRIKTDVEDVPDDLALQQVKQLETKYYHYLDPARRKQHKTIGFMAQETKEVIPNAVSLISEFIPDELCILESPEWKQTNNGWDLTINNLDFSNNNTGKCRFYVGNDPSGVDVTVKELYVNQDLKTFTFKEKYENVLLWGKQVNDFHTINKDMVFAVHHSALQELIRKDEAKTEKITNLENKVNELEGQLTEIKTMLNNLNLNT